MSARLLGRHDDVGLAFIDKPSGILVHNSAWAGPREHTLVDDARALFLGERAWHPLHRLDRQTSGVVAFARDDVVARWSAAFDDERRVDKRYWALVRGRVVDPIDVDHAIKDDDTGVTRDARSRITPLLASNVDRCSLVEVRLFTGRRHQARRHLKHVAHPIIGDARHGKGPINRAYREAYGVARMALHARSLSIVDVDGARFGAVAPLTADLVAAFRVLFADQLDAVDRLLAL